MLIFYTAFFLSMAVIIFGIGYREPASRWLSYAFLQCGFGGATAIANELSSSDNLPSILAPVLIWGAQIAVASAQHVVQFLLAYFAFIFSLYYSGFLTRPEVRWIKIAAIIPVAATSFFSFFKEAYTPLDADLLFLWNGPYKITASILLLSCCFTANNIREKRSRTFCFVLLGLPLIIDLIIDYSINNYLETMSIDLPSVYEYFVPIFMLIVFLFGSVRYGLMGIKINIQQRTFRQSTRMLTSGTAVVNATLAKEVTKMKLMLDPGEPDSKHRTEHSDLMFEACDRILQLTHQIKERTGNFEINPGLHSLRSTMSDAVNLIKPLLSEKCINLTLSLSNDTFVDCDRDHLTKTFEELLTNAAEAIEHEYGEINITLSVSKHQINIRIADNGSGMTPEVAEQAPEPFFTTKTSDSNQGLGLSYAYSVIEKHGGSMTISSEPNRGTLVVAEFPRKRVYTDTK